MAKGNNLCFLHEDVLFHGNNWGYVFKLREMLYLMGVVLTFHKFYTSFEALRTNLSKGNMAGYIIIPKNI